MHTFEAIKDPHSNLDFSIDWSDWLGSDTIASSSWSYSGPASPSDLVEESKTYSTTATTVKVSGGTANRDYYATNRITTAAGLIDERTILIRCRNR
jgi:hypothetical protein